MKLPWKLIGIFAVAAVLLMPLGALADSIDPPTYTATVDLGANTTVTKTVTINEGTPTSSKVDVFFLSDTTGSMTGVINSVKANASTILTNTAGLGDVAFGVGEYKDNGDVYVYRLNQDITTVQAAAQAGINMWGASGGGDLYEANLYALKQVADTTSWRTGSTRILVWFGDAAGHDPSGPDGTTEAQATAALQAKSIVVEALNSGALDALGQATRITAATGGTYYPTVDTSAIVAAIQAAIESVFASYSNVALDLSEVPAEIIATSVPPDYTGAYDRSVDRTFTFNLTFIGLDPGVYPFNIYATVDGGRVATEEDLITVSEKTAVPVPPSLLLLGSGLLGLAGLGRKKLI